jgi:OmpA-OmpF porin, OOP family
MKKIAFVALLSACIATPALADNTGKFYGAVDLGSVSFSNATGGPTGTTAFPNPGAFRFAAGYNITPMFAVEAGYAMIGTSQIDSVNFAGIAGVTATETVKSSSVQIAGVANYAINDTFGVFGKLGFANSKVDYAGTTNIGVTASASGSKTALTFGLGGQYNINKQFAIRAQYEDFGKVKVGAGANSDVGIKMVSIGGAYNF